MAALFALAEYIIFCALFTVLFMWPLWLTGYRRGQIGAARSTWATATSARSWTLYALACAVLPITLGLALLAPSDASVVVRIVAAIIGVTFLVLAAYGAEQIGEHRGGRTWRKQQAMRARVHAEYAAAYPQTYPHPYAGESRR